MLELIAKRFRRAARWLLLLTVMMPAVSCAEQSGATAASGSAVLAEAYREKRSDLQVQAEGTVRRVLRDDNEGSRHQRFILEFDNGQSVLVAHNIDLAPRIPNLQVGDRVAFNGEYEWNPQGGVIHWTHHDPAGRHEGGWLRHKGETYE